MENKNNVQNKKDDKKIIEKKEETKKQTPKKVENKNAGVDKNKKESNLKVVRNVPLLSVVDDDLVIEDCKFMNNVNDLFDKISEKYQLPEINENEDLTKNDKLIDKVLSDNSFVEFNKSTIQTLDQFEKALESKIYGNREELNGADSSKINMLTFNFARVKKMKNQLKAIQKTISESDKGEPDSFLNMCNRICIKNEVKSVKKTTKPQKPIKREPVVVHGEPDRNSLFCFDEYRDGKLFYITTKKEAENQRKWFDDSNKDFDEFINDFDGVLNANIEESYANNHKFVNNYYGVVYDTKRIKSYSCTLESIANLSNELARKIDSLCWSKNHNKDRLDWIDREINKKRKKFEGDLELRKVYADQISKFEAQIEKLKEKAKQLDKKFEEVKAYEIPQEVKNLNKKKLEDMSTSALTSNFRHILYNKRMCEEYGNKKALNVFENESSEISEVLLKKIDEEIKEKGEQKIDSTMFEDLIDKIENYEYEDNEEAREKFETKLKEKPDLINVYLKTLVNGTYDSNGLKKEISEESRGRILSDIIFVMHEKERERQGKKVSKIKLTDIKITVIEKDGTRYEEKLEQSQGESSGPGNQ